MKYQTEIEALVTFEDGGKANRKMSLIYGKRADLWMLEDYDAIEKYIRRNGIGGKKVADVSIFNVKNMGVIKQ